MGYTATRGQLAGDVRATLEQWLPDRLAPTAHTDFEISEFSAPNAGYSGKTVFFTASWTDAAGVRVIRDLVLRMQAADHQLFTEPDAVRQAEVMRILGRHAGVSTPTIVLTERDSAVLGAPFYLMERVEGRTPSDVPSWHKRGWTTELTVDQREAMCDNALRALVAVHQIDDAEDLAFLRGPGTGGTPLERYVDNVRRWYEQRRNDLVVGTEELASAMTELLEHAPHTDAETVVWGDARVGNMSFAEDLSVSALYDWETASTGPADIDLGWWLMFERYLCEALGFTRMLGVPDDEETVRRYLSFGGRLIGDISYFQLLAAVVLALITNRLALLLIRDGLDETTARSYPTTAVALVERYRTDHLQQRRHPAMTTESPTPAPVGTVGDSWEVFIERGKIREFAAAMQSDNEAYQGPEAVVPPTFLINAVQWAPPGARVTVGFDRKRLLHGEQEYIFHGELPRAGDKLIAQERVLDRYAKPGKRGGEMTFAVVATEFRSPEGALIAEARATFIQTAARGESK